VCPSFVYAGRLSAPPLQRPSEVISHWPYLQYLFICLFDDAYLLYVIIQIHKILTGAQRRSDEKSVEI